MAFDFTADHVAASGGNYEPQRLNHFSVRIPGLAAADIIEKSLMSWQPPQREIAEVVIPYGNEERKVAGKVTVSAASLQVVDYCDKDTWAAFHDWLDLVHDSRTGHVGLAKNYKKDVTTSYYGPGGEKRRAWLCQGCWPTSVAPDQFSMDSGDRNNLTVPLAVDKVIPAEAA